MADELDVLLEKVDDPALRTELRAQVDRLRSRRTFGLVFEDHIPERVRLPDHPIRRGVRVVRRDQVDAAPREVAKVAHGQATTVSIDGETETVGVDELVVVAEFGEPIYPGLERLGSIDRGGNKPAHVVINAENHHALEMLEFTHAGRIDCIYIDPPYNTGNEGWIYSDRYVSNEDSYKHSKWLTFMRRRLVLARRLLTDTGVIILAIGDDEHHRLRMLMDQEFGAQNFISDVVWIGSVKNDARLSGGGLDYMLIYGKSVAALTEADVRWREPKEGLRDVLAAGASAWEESNHDSVAASRLLSSWWGKNKRNYDPGLGDNVKVDVDGTVIKVSDLRSPNPRPNLQYDVLHPTTNLPVKRHPNGWVCSRDTMEEWIAEGRILFGDDHNSGIRRRTLLVDMSMQSVRPRFYKDRRAATRYLERVLGDRRFPNPKDHEVLMRWISIVARPDAVMLDFFAGSGSTAEAVMRLNAQDGGTRQCIVVTNNELSTADAKRLTRAGWRDGDVEWEARGVFEYVTRPRIETVTTGTRPDGSVFDADGLAENVEFLKLTYQDPLAVELDAAFEAVAPLLWLRAGGQGPVIETRSANGWAVTERYGILFDPDQWRSFVDALTDTARTVFVVTDSDSVFTGVAGAIPGDVDVVRLYENYLSTFTINRAG